MTNEEQKRASQRSEIVEAAGSAGWVTPASAAEATGRTPWEVHQLVVDGLIPALTIGNFVPVPEADYVPRVGHLVRLVDVIAAPRRVRLASV